MITIRPLEETDEAWETLARTQSAYFDTFPINAERARHRRKMMPEGTQWTALIATADGADVGTAMCFDAVWIDEPNQIYLLYAISPADAGSELERRLFAEVLAVAHRRRPSGIHSEVESRRPENIALLEGAGFQRKSTMVYSEIDLSQWESSRFIHGRAREGIRIVSVAELGRIDPDWKEKYVQAYNDSMVGMPSYVGQSPFTLDLLEKLLVAPGIDAELRFVALDDRAEILGITNLNRSPVDSRRFTTGATGVRPEHRRRGIATLLKAHAIARAQDRGGGVIGTENEETNPMLELNFKLGFERRFDIYTYVWRP